MKGRRQPRAVRVVSITEATPGALQRAAQNLIERHERRLEQEKAGAK